MQKFSKTLASPWTPRLLITGLLLIMLVRMIDSALGETPSSDEPANMPSGYVYLLRGDYIDGTHPPLLRYWISLPYWFLQPDDFPNDPTWYRNWKEYGRQFIYQNTVDSDVLIFWPRFMVMLLALGLGVLIGRWARERNGTWAGVLAVALYSLDPNMLAHGHYVTTDMAVTLACFAAVYLFWKYHQTTSWLRLVAAAFLFACALLTKFTAMLLAPSLLLIAGLVTWLRRRSAPLAEPWYGPRKFWVLGSVYVVVTLLVIFAAYRFEVRSISQDEQMQLGSWVKPVYRYIHQAAPQLGSTPEVILNFPIPAYNFVKGFTLQMFHSLAQNAWRNGKTVQYGMGRYSNEGWWWYYPLAFLIKTPLVLILALLAAGILGYLDTQRPLEPGWPLPARWVPAEVVRHEEFLFLIVPVAVFMGAYMASTINIGHRYLLPLYPFLYVLASRIAAPWRGVKSPRLPLYLSIFAVLASLPGSITIHPHYASYFNELVWPKNGYKYIADSNVDWGQYLGQLKEYLDEKDVYNRYDAVYVETFGTIQPEDLGIEGLPLPRDEMPSDRTSLVAISVNKLLALTRRDPESQYQWLRQEIPIDHIGYGIWIYDLSGKFPQR